MLRRLRRPELCILLAVMLVVGVTAIGRFAAARAAGVTAPLSAGGFFACALTAAGGVQCWGRNASGELGDGTTNDRSVAVDVLGMTSGVSAISSGGSHACGLTTMGDVKCWGDDSAGQLGDGTTRGSSTPVDVSGLASGVAAVSAGGSHTCALTVRGGVKCWGDDSTGQLGDGTARPGRFSTAYLTRLTSRARTISAQYGHACVITRQGRVKCWGDDRYGQLGDGTTRSRFTPVAVGGLTGVLAISAGADDTCALTDAGGVKCWGAVGWLPNGRPSVAARPVGISGLAAGVTAISAGAFHACALMTTGAVKCWGSNIDGELGNGTMTSGSTAVEVLGLASRVTSMSAGWFHTCAVTSRGGVQCWGLNANGELGDGTIANSSTPVHVSGLTRGVVSVSAGYADTCAVTAARGVQCWGDNRFGQFGDGTMTNSPTPRRASTLTAGVTAVSSGQDYNCALMVNGGVKCWGLNNQQQLGDGTTTNRSTPVSVLGIASGVTAISGTCALSSHGVKCWGDNGSGKLGIDPGWIPVDTGGSYFVVRAPPAPTIRRAVVVDEAVAVTVTPPSSDGGSPVVTLRASCTSSDGGRTVSESARRGPIAVAGLTELKTYSCTVIAENAIGPSLPSAPSPAFVFRASRPQG